MSVPAVALRHRPTERRAVIELLDKEHDSVETLADDLLDLLVEIKWGRGSWIAIQRHTGPHFTAWGPYPTRGEAERDVGRRIIAASPQDVAYFCRVWNKDVLDGPQPDIWEETYDDEHDSGSV